MICVINKKPPALTGRWRIDYAKQTKNNYFFSSNVHMDVFIL